MRALFAIPGGIDTLTGGYGYDREILARATSFGVDLAHLPLPGGFPFHSAEELAETARLFAESPERVALIDGLAFGAFDETVLDALPQTIVALVHHPLALESGLAPAQAERLRESERRALARASRVVTTSAATRDELVRHYGVDATRVAVAPPGVDAAPRALAQGDPPRLLAVGSLTPRKGYDVLIDALAELRDLDWSLVVVGSPSRAPDHAEALRARVDERRLDARIRFAGEVDDAARDELYASSDLFVLSSHYEGYGMVLGEAMVRGLPIVATRAGAAAETAPDAAALKVAPGDVVALAQALRRAIAAPDLRRTLAEASFRAGQSLPSWDDAARTIAQTLMQAGEER